MITQDELKNILEYDPFTGIFTWKIPIKGTKGKGKQAGTLTRKGYVDVCISGKKYGTHRLAFLYMTGTIPANVDHRNGVKSDNKWENLRSATVRENSFNYKGRKTSSGYKNVYYDKRGIKKWFICIFDAEGNKHHFGYFHTPEEANEVAKGIRNKFHGEFAHH